MKGIIVPNSELIKGAGKLAKEFEEREKAFFERKWRILQSIKQVV